MEFLISSESPGQHIDWMRIRQELIDEPAGYDEPEKLEEIEDL